MCYQVGTRIPVITNARRRHFRCWCHPQNNMVIINVNIISENRRVHMKPIMNMACIYNIGQEWRSTAQRASKSGFRNKALSFFGIYSVFTGGFIFLYRLAVSQAWPWRPKSICVALCFNVLLWEPLIPRSLSPCIFTSVRSVPGKEGMWSPW